MDCIFSSWPIEPYPGNTHPQCYEFHKFYRGIMLIIIIHEHCVLDGKRWEENIYRFNAVSLLERFRGHEFHKLGKGLHLEYKHTPSSCPWYSRTKISMDLNHCIFNVWSLFPLSRECHEFEDFDNSLYAHYKCTSSLFQRWSWVKILKDLIHFLLYDLYNSILEPAPLTQEPRIHNFGRLEAFIYNLSIQA